MSAPKGDTNRAAGSLHSPECIKELISAQRNVGSKGASGARAGNPQATKLNGGRHGSSVFVVGTFFSGSWVGQHKRLAFPLPLFPSPAPPPSSGLDTPPNFTPKYFFLGVCVLYSRGGYWWWLVSVKIFPTDEAPHTRNLRGTPNVLE